MLTGEERYAKSLRNRLVGDARNDLRHYEQLDVQAEPEWGRWTHWGANAWAYDLAYDAFATRVVEGGSTRILWKGVDQGVIDGAVNGTAALAYRGAARTRQVQTGRIRSYALLILGGAVALLGYLLWS